MAAANSEVEPILLSRNNATRYDSFGTQSYYPTTSYGPELEETSTEKRPLLIDDGTPSSLRNR
jgi:hypothetical protein